MSKHSYEPSVYIGLSRLAAECCLKKQAYAAAEKQYKHAAKHAQFLPAKMAWMKAMVLTELATVQFKMTKPHAALNSLEEAMVIVRNWTCCSQEEQIAIRTIAALYENNGYVQEAIEACILLEK